MKKNAIPKEVRHRWRLSNKITKKYRCPDCDCWTCNLSLWKDDICDAKDRRKGLEDRRRTR